MMADNLTKLPVINEQEVAMVTDKILGVTDDVPNELMLAALADLLGATAMAINDNPDGLIDWARHRAWQWVHTVFVKRTGPPPDTVTPFIPPKPHEECEE